MTRRRAIQPGTEAGVFGVVDDLLSVRASLGAPSTASGLLFRCRPLAAVGCISVGDASVPSYPTVATQENSYNFACELRGTMRD